MCPSDTRAVSTWESWFSGNRTVGVRKAKSGAVCGEGFDRPITALLASTRAWRRWSRSAQIFVTTPRGEGRDRPPSPRRQGPRVRSLRRVWHQPSVVYGWQKQVFDNLEGCSRSEGGSRAQATREKRLHAASSGSPNSRPSWPGRRCDRRLIGVAGPTDCTISHGIRRCATLTVIQDFW
jgi:hypothetical protein